MSSEKQTPQPVATHFQVSQEGLNEIATAIQEVIPGKYTKQTIFNVINSYIKPVFPEVKTDKDTSKSLNKTPRRNK